MQTGPYIRQYGIANGRAADPKTLDQFTLYEAEGMTLYQEGGYAPKEVIVKLIYTDEEYEVVSKVQSTLKTFVEETMGNWILGTVPLDDSSWNNFIKTLDETGAYDLLKAAQAAYDRSK